MAREVGQSFPTEPALFSVHQVHPRAALAIGQYMTWKWLFDHVAGFRSLVKRHGMNWVIVGAHVHYLAPFAGHDADCFEARTAGLRLCRENTVLDAPVELSAGGQVFARTRVLYRAMELGGDETLSSATPGAITGELLARFLPEERAPERLPRAVPPLIETAEREGRLLAESKTSFLTHRHLCELADQWCYIELPVLASVAREALVRARGRDVPQLRHGLGRPMRSFDAEFRRPFLLFDSGRTATRAYARGEDTVFVHRLLGDRGEGVNHALAVETF